MGPGQLQAGLLQFLPILGVFCALWTSSIAAQESFPNELNSPVDEPQVIVRENAKVPVRTASQEVQQSTDPLVKLAWETREATRRRLLSTAQHTPWQMMHGLLGLRHDFLIQHNGEAINGLEWMRTGPTYQNEPWFQKTQFGGQAHPYTKPYWFEGHINQSLAILAQCEVPLETTFQTPDGPISMREMLKNAQMTVNAKEEVTWTLWALCTYLPSDAKWVNAKGEQWSIERLVQVEVGKPVGGPTSPCGGTHGLYALARARNIYMATGKPLRGVWYQADQKIKKYIQVARFNQNANGTLSSAFFKGKEFKQDFDKRMASTGHQLEFLMMALDDRQLKEPWVRRAVEATASDLMANRKEFVSCSPLYHATNALTIFLERSVNSQKPQNIAQRPTDKTISITKDLTQSKSQGSPGSVPEIPKSLPATVQQSVPGVPSIDPRSAEKTAPSKQVAAAPAVMVVPALKPTPLPPKIESNAASTKPETQNSGPLSSVPLPDLTIPVSPTPVPPPDKTSETVQPLPPNGGAPEVTPATLPGAKPEIETGSKETGSNGANSSERAAEAVSGFPMPIHMSTSIPFAVTLASRAIPATEKQPSQPEPVVSAERPDAERRAEFVASLLVPVPLTPSPMSVDPKEQTSEPTTIQGSKDLGASIKGVSITTDLPATVLNAHERSKANLDSQTITQDKQDTPVLVMPMPTAPSANVAAPVPASEQPHEAPKPSSPAEKPRWKSTPLERRRTLSPVPDPPS